MTAHTPPTWREGLRDVSPVILGIIPFGLIFGVTAAGAAVDQLAAWASSLFIFAGASQFAIVDVMGSGGAAVTAFLTAVVINSRHLMYSADMGRYTSDLPLGLRARMAYILTDQAYVVTAHRFPDPSSTTGLASYYFGVAMGLWTTWQITTTSGFILGQAVPASWRLEFAVPMVFLALLVFSVKTVPALFAAAVGGFVALAGMHLDYQLGLMLGAVAGVLAGLSSEQWFSKSRPAR
ncbi:MAG: AzlC family ABC transporter permease [Acidimicrobiia bacterium]